MELKEILANKQPKHVNKREQFCPLCLIYLCPKHTNYKESDDGNELESQNESECDLLINPYILEEPYIPVELADDIKSYDFIENGYYKVCKRRSKIKPINIEFLTKQNVKRLSENW